jgi:hypothetical protein
MQMKTGLYFSSRGHGAAVWELLVRGANIEQITHSVASTCGASHEQVAKDIEAYVVAAQSHGLGQLVADDRGMDGPVAYLASGVWAAPVFEVFSDMQDLLLLDPVHDVSAEMGWPQQKPL